jgi:hypothetical protein
VEEKASPQGTGGLDMPRMVETGFTSSLLDRENRVLALLLVKEKPIGEEWASYILEELAKFPEDAEFVLAIDPRSIRLYRPAKERLGEPLVEFNTMQVLQHYDPDLPTRRVFEFYLVTLAEAWLRDLAYHWKSATPPGAEELRRVGLLEKLEGGTTYRFGD